MKKQKSRRITAIMVGMTLILGLLSNLSLRFSVYAAVGTGTVDDPIHWNLSTDGSLTITPLDNDKHYIVTSDGQTAETILVQDGVKANITLDNVNISADCAIDMNSAGTCTITLAPNSHNILRSGNDRPGIYVPLNYKLTIKGIGSLEAYGAESWPGIGRNGNGNIEIESGTINASGGLFAAGIGGSDMCDGGVITITGGDIKATAGGYGAGIGGGMSGDNKTITITGGNITAAGGGSEGYNSNGGAGIGGGGQSENRPSGNGGTIIITGGTIRAQRGGRKNAYDIGIGNKGINGTITITGGSVFPVNGAVSPQPTNGNVKVYLNTLVVGAPAINEGTTITACGVDTYGVYDIKDVVTDANGRVCFWLPENNDPTASVSVTADNTIYNKSYTRGTSPLSEILTGSTSIFLSPSEDNDFGSMEIGYTTPPDAHLVTITNEGLQIPDGLSVSLSGGNKSSFTLSDFTSQSPGPGQTTCFTVQPKSGLPDGMYTETVTASGDNFTSQTFDVAFRVLTNAKPPSIIAGPKSDTVPLNGDVQLEVTGQIQGDGDISYQWYSSADEINWAEIEGAADPYYSPDTSRAGITYYYVKVTNTNTSVSGTQTASVNSESVSVTVNKKELTVNVTIEAKPYDGLTSAMIQSSTLIGVEGTDNVTLTNGTAKFESVAVGDNKPITFTSDFSISGPNAQNYTLVQPTDVKGNIMEGFTPINGTHYTLSQPDGTDGWYVEEAFAIIAKNGYKISQGNLDESDWQDVLQFANDTADISVSFYVRNIDTNEISIVKAANYKLDKTPPVNAEIKIDKINDGAFARFMNFISFNAFFKEGFKVTVTSSDETSGVATISYSLDGENYQTVQTETDSISFSVTSDFKGTIKAYATDKAGNQSTVSESDGVVNEADLPIITIKNENDFENWLSADKEIEVTVKDADSGINQITYSINDSQAVTVFNAAEGTKLNTSESFTIPINSEGNYHVSIIAEDNSGNVQSRIVTVKLDKSAPDIVIPGSNPVTIVVGSIFKTPEATANDILSGVNGNVTYSGTVDSEQIGEYTITYKATDNVGNVSVETLTIKVVEADKGELEELMDAAKKILNGLTKEDIGNGDGQYPKASVDDLTKVIEEAAQVIINDNSSEEDIANAFEDLQKKICNFEDSKIKVDFSNLDDTINKAGNIVKGNYTDETWQSLRASLNQSKTIRIKVHVTQAEVDAATQELLLAINGLKNDQSMPHNPQTGDASLIIPHFIIMLLSFAGTAIILKKKKI